MRYIHVSNMPVAVLERDLTPGEKEGDPHFKRIQDTTYLVVK